MLEDTWLNFQYQKIAFYKRFDPGNALIIAGDPRGGTTWLAEIINQLPGTALIWEPLAVSKVREFRAIGFLWRQFIPEHDQWPEAREVFRRLLSGSLVSPYLCQQTSPADFRKAELLLIKFCRANQLLPWITQQFELRYKPIYLVRHPCAVVASQLKQGGWSHVTPKFEILKNRHQSYYLDHKAFLDRIDTVEKKLAATWCLCNKTALDHPGNNVQWITITYETLLQDPSRGLDRIAAIWNMTFPQTLYDFATRPSATTVEGSPIRSGEIQEQLSYWKKQLSEKQKADILSVLDYFKIDLYGAHELPCKSFDDTL